MSLAVDQPQTTARLRWQAWLPWCVAIGVYGLLVVSGNALLRDPDTFWQIAVGREIVDTAAVPHVDIYSWTMAGQPWISTQWLAQVLLAEAYRGAGWAGPIVLSAACAAGALGLLTDFVAKRATANLALIMACIALALIGPHIVARPHVLAMPVIVVYAAGLVNAMDGRRAPSWWLVPVMGLWANLHGSFVFGILLGGACGLVALADADARARAALALQWTLFGVALVAACGVTPYGYESFLAAGRILGLGSGLTLIGEWRPANFEQATALEMVVIGGFGLLLWRSASLAPLRAVLIAGLVFMALSHIRNADMLALIAPLVLARPLGQGLARQPDCASPSQLQKSLLVAGTIILTLAVSSFRQFAPDPGTSPTAAIHAVKNAGLQRVLNGYEFGGYMIWAGLPPSIDGRAELYGGERLTAHFNFINLVKPNDFFRMISDPRIQATLLHRDSAATAMLDHMPGWRRLHSDDLAVVHVRDAMAPAAIKPSVTQ